MEFKTSITSQTGAHQGEHGGDHVAGGHCHFSNGGPLQSRPPLVFQVEGELGKSEVALKSLSATVKLSIKNKQISVRKHGVEISPTSTH